MKSYVIIDLKDRLDESFLSIIFVECKTTYGSRKESYFTFHSIVTSNQPFYRLEIPIWRRSKNLAFYAYLENSDAIGICSTEHYAHKRVANV
jgi:hypothetical protein